MIMPAWKWMNYVCLLLFNKLITGKERQKNSYISYNKWFILVSNQLLSMVGF